jgi:hypothetical protein
MKYYIATSLKRIKAHNMVRDALNKLGHEITYDWTKHGNVKNTSISRLKEVAHSEINGVKEATFIVVLLPGGIGTHTELGASIAYNKIIFLHSLDEKVFQHGEEFAFAFYHHNQVTRINCSLENLAISIDQILITQNLIIS